MWKGPMEDPGGPQSGDDPKGPPSQQELQDLKDQFEQQQTLIAQLKEMLRKTDQTSVSQEKVVEYANTLTKMNARAKRSSQMREGKEDSKSGTTKKGESPASERIMLLRQQLEQNKVKLAERGKNQRGMEEMVTQIKAQFDDSQHLISQTPLNISLIEDRVEYSPNSSSQELYNILLNKDKRISELNSKIGRLEANVLDLQENIKEKDSVIDARTRAITLMSENLSKKGKTTLDTLDETKEQMRKMQETFVMMEEEMKMEKGKLKEELETKCREANALKVENERLTIGSIELSDKLKRCEDDYKLEVQNLQVKISELEELNSTLQQSPSTGNQLSRNGKKNKKGKQQQQKQKENVQTVDDDKQSELENQIQEYEKTIEHLQKLVNEKQEVINEMQNKIDNTEDDHRQALKELEKEIGGLKSKLQADSDVGQENQEISKLKQQLDESNKNMIKVKAQHKGKVKELVKKVDAFKKIGDVNAELVKLEAENSKLTQKVAELEEEKGQLQLNMVESKESINLDEVKDLEAKIQEYLTEISNKTEIAASLEESIQEKEEKISRLTEKVEDLSKLHSAHVKSDLTSIHFEEQLEKLETEKNNISEDKRLLAEENDILTEQIEALKKEKQEVTAKLDSYMQENIELMDRLEKLSAEKVSSAESIEIVENLTQQEKLELEAYQTRLSSKSTEHLPENPELNDSVNQLTEETSELLQKIELFTVERREVMEKMEYLSSENNRLNLKLKEVENNRDVLVETYEQLQTEKEELDNKLATLTKTNCELEGKLKTLQEESHIDVRRTSTDEVDEFKSLVSIQKQEIQELKLQLLSHKENTDVGMELNDKISTLEVEYTTLLAENEKLKNNAKNEIETELTKRISEFEGKLTENLEEIENYKAIIEENKDELTRSSNIIGDLRSKLTEKLNELDYYTKEVEHLNSVIGDLNSIVEKLEEENKNSTNENVNIMSSQLEDLRMNFNENLRSQIQDYENELEENSVTIKKLNEDLRKLTDKICETENLLETKDVEVKSLLRERSEKENIIKELESQLKRKDEVFHETCDELKTRCLSLQSQVERTSGSFGPLEIKVQELEKRNKEQLEKMKKIAANLKKKNVEYKELEGKCVEVSEKWQSELQEKDTWKARVLEVDGKLQNTTEQLREVEQELTRVQEAFNTKNVEYQEFSVTLTHLQNENGEIQQKNTDLIGQIVNYSAQVEDLQNIVREYETQVGFMSIEMENLRSGVNNSSNTELSRKDDAINTLNQQLESLQYSSKTTCDALQMKIHELEMYIENQDGELNMCKEKVFRLEEGLSQVEERRTSLERKVVELDSELQVKIVGFEQVSESKDYFEQRLLSLTEKDAAMEIRMKEMNAENQQLVNRNHSLCEEIDGVKRKLDVAESRLRESSEDVEKLDKLESQNGELNRTVTHLENEVKRSHGELSTLKFERERNESELQEQLEQYSIERKLLMEQFEVCRDQVTSLTQTQDELKAEIGDLTQKLDQQQTVFEENIHKYHTLECAHKLSLSQVETLSAQVSELDETLQDKNAELEVYRNEVTNSSQVVSKLQSELEMVRNESDVAKRVDDQITKISVQSLKSGDDLAVQPSIVDVDTKNQLFTWPDTKDAIDFVIDPSSTFKSSGLETNVVENTRDELLEKIKTLEFMLFNAEREKDNATQQCNELSDQVAKLVYERIESQVTVDTPVDVAKTCYSTQTQSVQIPRNPDEPVDEAPMQQTTSFLCFSDDKNNEDDNDWTWNPAEAKLEQEHMEQMQSISQGKELKQKLNECEEKIRVLELERENHLEELKQAQVKSGKLIKKLKEFKVKNDQLTAKLKSDDFGDLNDAIQDELKAQIAVLEKRVREISTELDKERHEKDNLAKRNDVLASANERMVEMKEKQDIDIMSWQRRNRELSAKLEQLEWGDDAFEIKNSTPDTSGRSKEDCTDLLAKIEELEETVKDLTLDNEDLQTLLEEQRNLRLEAEKAKSTLVIPENMKTEAEYTIVNNEKNQLQVELTSAQERIKEVSQQLQLNYAEKTQLEATVLDNNITIESLNQQLRELEAFLQATAQNNADVAQLEENLQTLKTKNEELTDTNNRLLLEIEDLKNNLLNYNKEKASLSLEKEEVNRVLNELKKQNEILEEQLVTLSSKNVDNSVLLETLQQKSDEITTLQELLNSKELEYQMKLATTVEQVVQEWSAHVDQRGNDVAESWKLHLDSRENEFMQVEQQLRKEIFECEEKCNMLVNENNELRKNVDTEIKNEIDKMSALQQQINDKQHLINELSASIKIKEDEIGVIRLEKSETDVVVVELRSITDALQKSIFEKDATIQELSRKLESVVENKSLENVLQEKENELVERKSQVKELQEKINHLESNNKTVADNERTINSLHIDLKERQNELHETQLLLDDAKNQLLQYKIKLSSLEGSSKEKDYKIDELNNKLQENRLDSNNVLTMQQQIYEYQQQINNYNVQLQDNYLHTETLRQEVENYKTLTEHVQSKQLEINRLKNLLQEKERDYQFHLESNSLEMQSIVTDQAQQLEVAKRKLEENEFNYSESMTAKDVMIESYKHQLDQFINDYKSQENAIRDNLQKELVASETQCKELEQTIREDENQLIELRSIIEEQVIKIEELKKELYEKSSNYDALIAEIDLQAPSTHKTLRYENVPGPEDEDLAEPVRRAELDLALYMLHQRDVRCEELTVELMQLLEERDTLQLRLSNAIREKEDLRSQVNVGESEPDEELTKSIGSTSGAVPKSKVILLGATGTELAAEATENLGEGSLADKLSELRTVGYRKDKTILDEQELRRMQQFSILQQHKDDVSKLPPEAAARLVDASYTLSRDVQSPSKVLLNWLWGRSTPKVNNV